MESRGFSWVQILVLQFTSSVTLDESLGLTLCPFPYLENEGLSRTYLLKCWED